MSKKWIPNGDQDFATMAQAFATNLAKDPERYQVAPAESDELTATVKRFRAALQASRFGERSAAATRLKEDARAEAEAVIRRLGHAVRANPRIDAASKILLGLRERTAKARQLPCPQEPPRLRFVRALHEGNGATPVHELAFYPFDLHRVAKPPGAVRLELFVDLVPPEEPIPAHPGANLASRPWYLRSYTRSPIKLTPPMARVPMRVVYWGRWADSVGAVGPFSATATAWIEGGSHHMLAPALGWGRKPVPVTEHAPALPGPADREPGYSVAVLEAQYASYHPQDVTPRLRAPPQTPEPRRLEGPPAVEAVEAA